MGTGSFYCCLWAEPFLPKAEVCLLENTWKESLMEWGLFCHSSLLWSLSLGLGGGRCRANLGGQEKSPGTHMPSIWDQTPGRWRLAW